MAVNSSLQPTLYQYYTTGEINYGLSANQSYFTLNNRNITIYSGAMHYFRVPKQYWRERLRKMRAAGLNTVETYIPWNLHEPQPNNFDFGNGGSDMEEFLDIKRFLNTAQEEDLFAIVRPGPYICAEWEFGGLPSWLLREKDIKIRTSDNKYLDHVKRYFNVLLKLLVTLQFIYGGPIIAFQIENEYASTMKKGFQPDKIYLEELRKLMVDNGIKELLFTSDSPLYGGVGTLPGILRTANFNKEPDKMLDNLNKLQKNRPTMVMEYWLGWFDHWSENHHNTSIRVVTDMIETILKYPASINFYMFHGGTSWGFMNGANIKGLGTDNSGYQPDTTSYDYDAPLTEFGGYTEKYYVIKKLIEKYNKIRTKLPEIPKETIRRKYNTTPINYYLNFEGILKQLENVFRNKNILPMELLPFNNNSGQSYGYTVYRKTGININMGSILKISGHVYDTVQILINNKLISPPLMKSHDLNGFGFWHLKNSTIKLAAEKNASLCLIVGNLGRNNYGKLDQFQQFKGLRDKVYLNEKNLIDWEIIPIEFKRKWTNSLKNWKIFEENKLNKLGLYKSIIKIDNQPQDTFLDMREWKMGIVCVNGFVLGRYMHLGPQQTLYLPASFLRQGENEFVVFEHFQASKHILFSDKPIYYTKE